MDLISRVKPFMKIRKAPMFLGQERLEGSVCHFPKNIHEVSDLSKSLMLSMAANENVILTETLETIHKERTFFIRLAKIHTAFEWLYKNNPYYSDLNHITNKDQCTISAFHLAFEIESPKRKGLKAARSRTRIVFLRQENPVILSNVGFYRGGIGLSHQGSERFLYISGMPCTEIAITACAYGQLKDPEEWTVRDTESIMDHGTTYYQECRARKQYPLEPLMGAWEMKGELFLDGSTFHIQPFQDIYEDYALLDWDAIKTNGVPNAFLDALSAMEKERFIVATTCGYTVGLINFPHALYLFDSHARNPEGFPDPSGACCLLAFSGIYRGQQLAWHFLNLYDISNGKNVQIDIIPMQIRVSSQMNEIIQHSVPPLVDEHVFPNEQSPRFADIPTETVNQGVTPPREQENPCTLDLSGTDSEDEGNLPLNSMAMNFDPEIPDIDEVLHRAAAEQSRQVSINRATGAPINTPRPGRNGFRKTLSGLEKWL